MKLINNHTSLDETAYLLKDKENREFLRESIHQLQDGNVKTLTPDDWENLKNTWNINEWNWRRYLIDLPSRTFLLRVSIKMIE